MKKVLQILNLANHLVVQKVNLAKKKKKNLQLKKKKKTLKHVPVVKENFQQKIFIRDLENEQDNLHHIVKNVVSQRRLDVEKEKKENLRNSPKLGKNDINV